MLLYGAAIPPVRIRFAIVLRCCCYGRKSLPISSSRQGVNLVEVFTPPVQPSYLTIALLIYARYSTYEMRNYCEAFLSYSQNKKFRHNISFWELKGLPICKVLNLSYWFVH
ncbi:hypothetical protein ALTERO38_60353 [Alteromonas sp. 38]|nr:hypothetical protein ALTERO38_60353 [Alteromonas sp. 38]